MTSYSLKMAAVSIASNYLLYKYLYKLSYRLFDFDRVCSKLHGLIRACISDTHAFNAAVPFKYVYWSVSCTCDKYLNLMKMY